MAQHHKEISERVLG